MPKSSVPNYKLIDTASPINEDDTVSIQFLPHWCKQLLLPLSCTSCISTLSLSFIWQKMITLRLQHPLRHYPHLKYQKFLPFLWSNSAIISTLSALSPFWNKSVSGMLETPLLFTLFTLVETPWLFLHGILSPQSYWKSITPWQSQYPWIRSILSHSHISHLQSKHQKALTSWLSQSSSIGSQTGTQISIQAQATTPLPHSNQDITADAPPMLTKVSPPSLLDNLDPRGFDSDITQNKCYCPAHHQTSMSVLSTNKALHK